MEIIFKSLNIVTYNYLLISILYYVKYSIFVKNQLINRIKIWGREEKNRLI